MFDKAKWSLCGGIASHRLQGDAWKQEIKLLVSELRLMVTDNSNFSQFKLSSFLLLFPLGQENTITSSTAIIISHFCFTHTALAAFFSISWKSSLFDVLPLLSSFPSFPPDSFVRLVMNGLPLPPWDCYLHDTVYHIKSKQNTKCAINSTRNCTVESIHHAILGDALNRSGLNK